MSSNCSGAIYAYDNNGNRTAITQVSILTTSSVTDERCGNDGQITITAQNTSVAYHYQWSNGKTTATIKGLSTGTYSVVITEPVSGFTCNQSFTINPVFKDSLQVIPQIPSCIGGSNGKAKIKVIIPNPKGIYTYRWSTSTDTSYYAVDSVSNLKSGKDSVFIRNSYTGCIKIIAFTIGVPPSFLTSVSQIPPKCHNGSDGTATVAIVGSPGLYTFSWTGSTIGTKTTQQITGIPAGTYIVAVAKIATGCTETKSVTITDPPPLFTISKTDSRCYQAYNGTASIQPTVGSVNNYSYAWTGPFTGVLKTAQISNLGPGVYHVAVTENAGNKCVGIDSVTITEPPYIIQDVIAPPINCKGQNDGTAEAKVIGSPNQYKYKWFYQDGGYYLNQTGYIATNLKPGIYVLYVTDASGCENHKPFQILESSFTGSDILYPNPSSGIVNIIICNLITKPVEYFVFNATGQQIMYGSTATVNGKMSLDLSKFAPGAYIIRIETEKQEYNFKAIKQ